ncbi:uncharacterized protein LOC114530875 [Dendronephthya gigantea]|uniref:uncharacterized protein LOC114530875 n=1 Tax=Dendronephthya gigantea TaxID=151771 RepID=UPI00106CF23C|nr:uncharacterized protein LOC114530875 [Dendronephthya gigantea]
MIYSSSANVPIYVGVQCNILNVEEPSRAEMLLTLPEPEPGSEETGDDMDTSDEDFQCGDESESDKSELGDEDTSNPTENLRQQPKYIIFLSQLLLLFKFCHYCKADDPLVETTTDGTLLIVRTTCANPVCSRKNNIWRSQPLMPTTKLNACDFLLSFAILVSGGSPTKVLNMFRHMGLVGMCNESYYRHQGKMLFPTIFLHWEDYRRKILGRLQALESLVISGDGRHDSMGHSAKYGAYTIFCCTSAEIIDFSLIQRNEVGSSPAMEFEGFQRCLNFLLAEGLDISTFVSDRHQTIAKHMREKLPKIKHYFDIWHLKKKLHKVLTKLAKEADCEELAEWIQPCINHLYWSATSTYSGNGRIILAKFKSFLGHIVDKHDGFDDPLYDKCVHGELTPRKWILPDSPAYTKLSGAMLKKSFVKGIKQASPLDQTSCLEGFHSVINQFSPKMNAYSFSGIYCRHILAAIHFNANLCRKAKLHEDGTPQVKVSYPKFKGGDATVRESKVKQNFGKEVKRMNGAMSINEKASEKLKEMTPAPMNTMFENKELKEIAIKKQEARKNLVVEDVPPTTISVVLAQEKAAKAAKAASGRAAPRCSLCKNLMKGHKEVKDCPKNQKQTQQ